MLIDCGSPVTLIRADMWEQVRQPYDRLQVEEEEFQGVTKDGLQVLGLAHLELHFGGLHVEHPAVVVDKIAQRSSWGMTSSSSGAATF